MCTAESFKHSIFGLKASILTSSSNLSLSITDFHHHFIFRSGGATTGAARPRITSSSRYAHCWKCATCMSLNDWYARVMSGQGPGGLEGLKKKLHKKLSQGRLKKKKSCMARRLSTRVLWSKQDVGVLHLDRNGLSRPLLVWTSSTFYNSCTSVSERTLAAPTSHFLYLSTVLTHLHLPLFIVASRVLHWLLMSMLGHE